MSMRGGVEGGHISVLDWVRTEVSKYNRVPPPPALMDFATSQRSWGKGMWRNAAYAGKIATGWEFAVVFLCAESNH